jgi:hypothetical protein
MDRKKLDGIIAQVENYLECLKHFNDFMTLARTNKFGQDHETQFLELKAVLAQQLEIILAAFESINIDREEILRLLGAAPSLRLLAEHTEARHREMENSWHKIFIEWQGFLGKLKVQQLSAEEPKSFWGSLFGKKK